MFERGSSQRSLTSSSTESTDHNASRSIKDDVTNGSAPPVKAANIAIAVGHTAIKLLLANVPFHPRSDIPSALGNRTPPIPLLQRKDHLRRPTRTQPLGRLDQLPHATKSSLDLRTAFKAVILHLLPLNAVTFLNTFQGQRLDWISYIGSTTFHHCAFGNQQIPLDSFISLADTLVSLRLCHGKLHHHHHDNPTQPLQPAAQSNTSELLSIHAAIAAISPKCKQTPTTNSFPTPEAHHRSDQPFPTHRTRTPPTPKSNAATQSVAPCTPSTGSRAIAANAATHSASAASATAQAFSNANSATLPSPHQTATPSTPLPTPTPSRLSAMPPAEITCDSYPNSEPDEVDPLLPSMENFPR